MEAYEREYQQALRHLRASYRAMRILMDGSDDWTAVVALQEDYRHLRDACTSFARLQVALPSLLNGSRGRRSR